MAPPQRTKRRYGLPWAGYQSSQPPHLCPPDKATSDGPSSTRRSQNYLYNPVEGKFFRRAGMAVAGGTDGILENGTGEMTVARCRSIFPLRSSSLADGYPIRCSLWTEEGNNKGALTFYNTNGTPADQPMGSEFGSTQYPTTAGGGNPLMAAVPYIRTTDDTVGRFHSLAVRAHATPGSRRALAVGDQLYLPNKDGTPWHWNMKFNDSNADTGDVFRVKHTGRPSPLGLPTITTGTLNSTGSWHEGDRFYVSVAYRFADGSVSMPIIPRDRNDEVNLALNSNHTGFGRVDLARSGGFTDRYLYLTWTTIPIGPAGCVGRYLLRTPKNPGKDGATGNDGTDPAPLDLRVTAYIPNNTQTTYQDANGNDLALEENPLIVRFDHIMQPPARYIGTFDGRVAVGYTKPHPVAIYLAPNLNIGDTDGAMDTTIYTYALTGGTLTLTKTGTGSTTLTNIGDDTIQQLIDRINNTTDSGANGGKWYAVHAPGADLTAQCDDVGTAADNDNLVSITGATDFSGDGNGVMRAFSFSLPAPIFFSSTYLAAFATEKRRIFFTMASPGMPRMAACSWAAGNYRTAPESWGDFMGFGALPSGAVACFSKAIGVLQNRKSGISGEDDDYLFYDLNPSRGCISSDSIVEFNGAVGYLTADGFVVTDGKDEVVISGDVWNAATATGELDYEIGQCREAAESDTDIARFSAKVMGGKLYCSYRLTGTARAAATDAHPDSWLVYDFTGSAQFSGLRGVLRPDGTPWGWSTRQTVAESIGTFGEVTTASGVARYIADEDATGQAANGRIHQIETGALDGAANVVARLWTARDLADHLRHKSVQEVTLLFKKAGTGMSFEVYRDGLGTTADADITLPTSGSNNFSRLLLPMPQAATANAEALEYRVDDTTASSQTATSEIWGFEAELLLLDSYT